MINIYKDLSTIAYEEKGSLVCSAISGALKTLNEEGYDMVDISNELNIIEHGIYGKDIRMAIYNALYKLASYDSPINTDGRAIIGELESPKPLIKSGGAKMFWIEETKTR